MNASAACAALLLIAASSFAQPAAKKPVEYPARLTSELESVRDAAVADGYAYRELAHLSHNIGPRLSGSAQAAKAVEYVAAEMRTLGLEVSLEKVMVPHWVRGVETAELTAFPGQAAGTTQKVVLTALGGSTATAPEGLTAEVVVVRSMAELTALGREKVAGKIVLYDTKYDKQMAAAGQSFEAYHEAVYYRAVGATRASRLGAVASLVRSVGSADFRLPHTGGVDYATDTVHIPAGAVASEDAEMIADLAAQGPVFMHLVLTPQTLPDAESANVIAELKGTEHPEQIVIVSGHLDSWDLGTGSIDDGSGVAMAMQTMATLKKLGLKPKRTIRMVAWINEENGARGAKTYALDHANAVADHILAIESDTGAGHAMGINTFMTRDAVALLEPASKVLRGIGAGMIHLNDGPVETDVTPLQELGVPGIGMYNDNRLYFHYHHTAADTLDKVVPRELQENASVMATMAWAAANMPEVLPR
jgi:hypothetical protein